MKSHISKVWHILNRKERKQLSLVSGLQVFSGLTDMLGVVSVVPFLSVAAKPEILRSNAVLIEIKEWLRFSDGNFLIFLGVFSLLALLINQVMRLVSGWYGQVVSNQIWWNLHRRMFRYYLEKSYLYHLQNAGSVLLEKLQVRINAAVAGVIQPIFLLMGSFFSGFFVLSLLVYVEPMMTVILLGTIALFYILVFQKIKSRLDYYGKISPEFSNKSFKLIAEAFGAIKEIKVRRNSKIYLDMFDPLAKRYCESQVKIQLFGTVPSGMVEIVAFGGILIISLLMINDSGGFQEAIPLLGMYALALRRILPTVQDTYRQITQIRFYQPSLQVIQDDLIAALPLDKLPNPKLQQVADYIPKLQIELKNLSFEFPGSNKKVLDSISLKISAGSLIGIAGMSGAGKTTLVDLILGLYEPISGKILIDGKPLSNQSLSEWQSSLGYVPQSGFIADGSIAKNIAFGIPEAEMDMERVKEMARIAHILEFIESELPKKYETQVGERGVRLSGGQRQRLSIARALYYDPDFLIFDEATSALDGITEEKIMNSIFLLAGQKTIIIIAHRLTTLKECDSIFFLEEGKIVDQGSYSFLMEKNTTFRHMARGIKKDK